MVYITQHLLSFLLSCYRIKRSSTFPGRLGATTKEFKGREFWFQLAFFSLNPFFVGSVICLDLEIPLALYILFQYSP